MGSLFLRSNASFNDDILVEELYRDSAVPITHSEWNVNASGT